MRKNVFIAITFFAISFANAQDQFFKFGSHVGVPNGDLKDSYSYNLGLDIGYVWSVYY